MAVQRLVHPDEALAALLGKAREEPLILETDESGDFAVLPLDDEVIDLLLERSRRLREECRGIRERMRQGTFLTHDEVLKALEQEP